MKAVILAGGTGTRLWPMSHDLKPKQFHAFVGEKTMLQQTYERLSFLKPEDIYVATNKEYVDLVKKQLPTLSKKRLIIEPAMRDTGPSICYSANILKNHGFENEVMCIIYADHLIQNPSAFEEALKLIAGEVETQDCLGVLAVRAKYPNPQLGYIRIGSLLKKKESGKSDSSLEVYELDKFVEKPDMETARQFLYSYKYFWNTGLYVWTVKKILQKFEEHAPHVYDAVVKKNRYEEAPKISIDFCITEKVEPHEVIIVPANLGWSDIGNWSALHEELAHEEKENVINGKHVTVETEGCIIYSESGKTIATLGVKDLVIVETEDAILVVPRERAAEVKDLVSKISAKPSLKRL